MKYSLGIIIFGLIFAFSFQANRVQILKKPVRIAFDSEEVRQYQVSGWQGAYVKGKESILKVALPEKKTYRLVIKAFSCSPPDVRDQRMEVHFNDVALDRLQFRKTSEWQEFSVTIPYYLLQETNTIKFVYTQDIFLSPIAFQSLEVRNYIFRIKGLYLLFSSPLPKFEEKHPLFIKLLFSSPLFPETIFSFKVLGYSFGFVILFWLFWLFYSRFFSFVVKMKFSRATKIDLMSWLPSIIFFPALALVSFFFPYRFVYSLKTFFVLALAPTVVLKLCPYRVLLRIIFRYILRDIEKTCSEIERAYSACLSFLSFLKRPITTFRKFLIRYHKTNLSSAFILDFMLLLVLCAFLLMIKGSTAYWIADRIASFAYILLVIGVIMKIVQITQKEKTGDEKRFIRIEKRDKISFKRLILKIAKGGKVPFPRLILRIEKRDKISFKRLILKIAKGGKVPFPRLILRIKKIGKVPFKKIILRLVSILLVSLFLWLILPGKGVEVTQLIPQETFTFVTLKIDLNDPGASELLNNFNWWIRWGVRLLGPVEIAALATPAVSKEEPDYLFLVKNNRLIKISRLLRRSIDKAMISEKPFKKSKYKTCQILHVKRHPDNLSSYTLFRDIALFSNNPSLLKASLDQSGKETSFISGEALSDFRELQSSGEALFFINNSHFELSRALKSLEEKSVYAILPTVGSLNYLGGYFNILDADSLKGSLRFKYREKVDIKEGQEDIYFLAGLLKRLCRANGLNFEEGIIIEKEDRLNLNFRIFGLKSFIAGLVVGKEEEELSEVKGEETEVSSSGILKKRKRPEHLS